MRVVMLDFDGVLNSHVFLWAPQTIAARDRLREYSGNEHVDLDPAAIARLDRILEATGAKVVIISSWRHFRTVERLEEILRAQGFTGEVIDKTVDHVLHEGGTREGEIPAWLEEHPEVAQFVILDDCSYDSPLLQRHLVQTTYATGLQDEHVEAAIRHLLDEI